MEWLEWLNLILSVVAGIAACIPLVIKLVECVQKAVREKNWPIILAKVMEFMAKAERKFSEGADRKEFVLGMIESFAKTVDYPIDLDVIGKMIDDMCAMSKKVNVEVVEAEIVE